MMWVNSKMKLALVLMVVLLLVLVGCRQTPASEPEEPVDTPEVEAPEDVEEEPEQVVNESEDQLIEAEGKYVGFADSNSVEIELIGESQPFMVFQLDDDVRNQLEEEEFDTGTEVTIIYRELEQGQPVIMEITAK